jgi:hypothetical protein
MLLAEEEILEERELQQAPLLVLEEQVEQAVMVAQ